MQTNMHTHNEVLLGSSKEGHKEEKRTNIQGSLSYSGGDIDARQSCAPRQRGEAHRECVGAAMATDTRQYLLPRNDITSRFGADHKAASNANRDYVHKLLIGLDRNIAVRGKSRV